MARIPDDVIERLKREVSLERLVEARGRRAQAARGGPDRPAAPSTTTRRRALVITPKKNLWHCLGACQQGGSVIDWVMKARGVSFRHAVEILRERRADGAGERPRPARCCRARSRPRPRTARLLAPGRRLLPRDAEAEPGGARRTSRSAGSGRRK